MLRVLWLGGLCVVVALAPILASDLVVMIPLSVMFLLGGGPISFFAKQLPTCAACGLERPHPGWHETPCRPVRGLAPRWPLRVAPSERVVAPNERENDEPSGVFTRPGPP